MGADDRGPVGLATLALAQGVAVAMVDFRNCLTASSAPEVAPFPAGLDDCVSGVRWVVELSPSPELPPIRISVPYDDDSR